MDCCTGSGAQRSLVVGDCVQPQPHQHSLSDHPSPWDAQASLGSQLPVSLASFLFVWNGVLGSSRERFPAEFQKMNTLSPLPHPPPPFLFGGLPAAPLVAQLKRNDVRNVYLLSKRQSSFQQKPQKGVQGSCQSMALWEYPLSLSCLSPQCLQERLSQLGWQSQLSQPSRGYSMSQTHWSLGTRETGVLHSSAQPLGHNVKGPLRSSLGLLPGQRRGGVVFRHTLT